jgi:protein-disulfide isomerase
MNQDNVPQPDLNPRPRNKDFDYPAYVLGAAVIIAAIIVSGTALYVVKKAGAKLDTALSAAQSISQKMAAQAAAGLVPSQQQPSAAAPSQAPSAPGAPVKIALKSTTPYLGASSAKVTVVEYADYECPFCEKFFSGVWPELYAKYVKTGKIKFFYQDFAFLGPDSNTAAEATHCAADQNKFWQYHDYLFSNQGQEGSGWATADHQKQFAQAVGLNTAQFNQCLDSGKYKTEVLNETAAGKSYGVSGTPTVFVNGVAIVGAQPASAFEKAIDAALK